MMDANRRTTKGRPCPDWQKEVLRKAQLRRRIVQIAGTEWGLNTRVVDESSRLLAQAELDFLKSLLPK